MSSGRLQFLIAPFLSGEVITGCREKIYPESAVVAKRRRLVRAIYFFTTAGDIEVSPSQNLN